MLMTDNDLDIIQSRRREGGRVALGAEYLCGLARTQCLPEDEFLGDIDDKPSQPSQLDDPAYQRWIKFMRTLPPETFRVD